MRVLALAERADETPGAPWTRREQAVLRKVYPVAGIKGCARFLPSRGLKAIRQRAAKLGIRREFRRG
ncbi:hypothetical protein [Sphingomonas sp. ID0503]|uniref:hypothetical protein n=1 Tax=Sphingomonas sp. ID0503 TaxID=3399691 RepID=UPI003AFB703E